MLRFFGHAHYDFLGVRKLAYTVSIFVAVPGLLLFAVRGLNESIEFTGGSLIQLSATTSDVSTRSIRSALDAAGIVGAEITTFGAEDAFVIRARLGPDVDVSEQSTQQTGAAVDNALAQAFGPDAYTIERVEAVGPKVGGELRRKAVLAIIMSFGAVLVYLWLRFEWRFGVAAVLATVHDIILTLAFVSLMNLEVSLVVVAGMLLIVGYSLNDTIITFDRVRENLRKFKRSKLYEVLNRSVNETLPRTILTSTSTIGATVALLVFGGETIHGFAWVVTFGIVVGTFSSIFIASPVLLAIEQRWPGEDVRGARTITATPEGVSAHQVKAAE